MSYRSRSRYYPDSPYRSSLHDRDDPYDHPIISERSLYREREHLKYEIEELLMKDRRSRIRPRDYEFSKSHDMEYSSRRYSGGYAHDLRELEEEEEESRPKKKKANKAPPKEFFCRDCQVTCTSRQTMETHLRGRQHLNAIKEVLDDETYCKVCRISYYGPFDLHIKSKSHKKCARTCNVCCQVFELDGEFQDHLKKHKSDAALDNADEGDLITVPVHDNPQSEPGEEPILMEMVEDVNGFFCKACQVFFRGDEKAKLEHCSSKKHLEKVPE